MNKILHNSVLYVNLEQLRRNVRTLLGELEGKELVPVLKGNAYGLGLERIGRELAAFEEIHTLAVAQVSEGADLRDAGVEKDILVLGGVPERLLAPAAELDLTLPVWRLGVLPQLARLGREQGRPVKVQVKVETGLHRVGLTPGAELSALLEEWRAARPWVTVTGAYSHFADLGDRERTGEQVRTYLSGVEQLEAGGDGDPLPAHLRQRRQRVFPGVAGWTGCASAGGCTWTTPQSPGDHRGGGLLAHLGDHLRELKAGDALGYGGHVRMERDGTVATIAVGYGDGLSPELVGANGPVLIRGRRVPMLACCMDQTIVDVTGLDCQVDDEVTLYGYDRREIFSPPRRCPSSSGTTRGAGSPPYSAGGWPGYTRNGKKRAGRCNLRHVQLVENLCSDESARVSAGELEGAAARLEWDRMP